MARFGLCVAMTSVDTAPPLLIGRRGPLQLIRGAIEQGAAGHGALVVISGEFGTGKTALAEAAAAQGTAAGLLPCWGRAWEEGGAPRHWPWTQVLRSLADAAPSTWLPSDGRAAASDRRLLTRLLPELAEEPPSPEPRDLATDFAIFEALRRALLRVGQEATPLLLLEDLHAADLATLRLLRLVTQDLRSLRVVVVGTYRPLAAKQNPEVDRLLAGSARDGRQIALQGLDERQTEQLLTRLNPGGVVAQIARRIHAATNGNPLLIALLAEAIALPSDDAHAHDPLPLTEGLRAVVRHQLRGLGEDARAVLAAGAVLGPEVDLSRLRALLADVDREQLLRQLGACVAAGVLVEAWERPGRYRFVHDVVRQVVEADLAPAERSGLHLRAAEVIEALHARDLHPHLVDLARHYVAGVPESIDRALDVSVRAAERSEDLLDLERATTLWRGAVSLAMRGGVDRLRRCDLLLRLGGAETRAGANGAARRTFLEAARVARAAEDWTRFADAALGCGGSAMSPTAGVIDSTLVELLREALAHVDATASAADAATRSALLGRLAMERYYVDPREVRDELTQEAVELAHRSGNRAVLGRALHARHYALWSLDDVEERLANATRILQVAREANDPELALQARTWRVVASLELGDAAAVDREIAVHRRLAEAITQPYHRWQALIFRGMHALLEGRFADAQRHAEAAYALGAGQDVDSTTSMGPNARMMYGVQLFNLRREQGRLHELDDTISELSSAYPTLPVWRCALALTRLQQGRTEEAREEVEHLTGQGLRDLPADGNWLIAVTLLADVAVGLADVERAAELRTLLRSHEKRVVVVAQGASCRGAVAHYLGLLSATCGEHEQAVAFLRRAVGLHDALGARPYAVRSRLALATSLAALGRDGGEVTRLIGDASAVARELGMAAALTTDDGTGSLPPSTASASGRPDASPVASPPGAAASEPAPAEPSEPVAHMVREGNRWTVTFEGRVATLRDAKGLRYLAALLSEPDIEHPAVVLERNPAAARDLKAARRHFGELQSALAETARTGDADRAAAVREEMRRLAGSLTGTGSGSSDRTEQARVNVTRAIRTALRNVAAADAGLGAHLDRAVRTGASCTYRPDPRAPITWLIDADGQVPS
jgi:tetratricopeptide (TPR) repeat protein